MEEEDTVQLRMYTTVKDDGQWCFQATNVHRRVTGAHVGHVRIALGNESQGPESEFCRKGLACIL